MPGFLGCQILTALWTPPNLPAQGTSHKYERMASLRLHWRFRTPLFAKAKAMASALGIPLREFVTQAVEEKLSMAGAKASLGWNALGSWDISTRRPRGYR